MNGKTRLGGLRANGKPKVWAACPECGFERGVVPGSRGPNNRITSRVMKEHRRYNGSEMMLCKGSGKISATKAK